MKIKSPRFFVTSAVMSVVVVSASVAIYVSAVPNTAASTPVTSLDLSSPEVAQAAMGFDPFNLQGEAPAANVPASDSGVAPTSADDAPLASINRQPADTPVASAENTPTDVPSGEKVSVADETQAAGSGQTTPQKGAVNAGKTASKRKLGIGVAVGGAVALGVGAVVWTVALDDDSKTVVRSPSAP
ncbi:MAG: hypothetical protein K8R91_04660 [Phycisphaerae bacterium]|nr:hypothetical protein [Phycisphaerae bacterium]